MKFKAIGLVALVILTILEAQVRAEGHHNCDPINHPEKCPTDCFGEPGGSARLDDCGVCDGDNLDKDECGVCFGDDSSCADCDGFPNGGAVVDSCGVCDGDNLDMDDCGVCFGDGSTCEPVCSERDLSQTIATLTSLASQQRKLLKKSAMYFMKSHGGKRAVRNSVQEALGLLDDNIDAVSFIEPIASVNCSYADLCLDDDSNSEAIGEYSGNSAMVSATAAAFISRSILKRKSQGKLMGNGVKLRAEFLDIQRKIAIALGEIPPVVYDCF